jgi:hypothetical protein
MSVQQELVSKLHLLETDVQRKYAEIILSQSATLYIQDKAGVGKSSVLRKIANILGMQVIDLIISQVDEADLGIYPKTGTYKMKDGTEVECFRYLPPEWAIRASEVPTLVIFEELNRSTPEKRNACLQILNDYNVGQYQMNKDNVYFAASGNLGNEDGNDVDMFDNAMINRLCIINHVSDYPTWKEEYGSKHVSKYIMEYLESKNGVSIYDDLHLKNNKSQKIPFASHRSWSNLSKYIMTIHHTDPNDPKSDIKDWNKFVTSVKLVSKGYIGSSATDFHRYLESKVNISSKDLIEDFSLIENKIRRSDVSEKTRLLNELSDMRLDDLTENNMRNIFLFLDFIQEKELVATYVKNTFLKANKENIDKLHLIGSMPQLFSDNFYRNFMDIKKRYSDIFKQTISGSSSEEMNLK